MRIPLPLGFELDVQPLDPPQEVGLASLMPTPIAADKPGCQVARSRVGCMKRGSGDFRIFSQSDKAKGVLVAASLVPVASDLLVPIRNAPEVVGDHPSKPLRKAIPTPGRQDLSME